MEALPQALKRDLETDGSYARLKGVLHPSPIHQMWDCYSGTGVSNLKTPAREFKRTSWGFHQEFTISIYSSLHRSHIHPLMALVPGRCGRACSGGSFETPL
jgi:hypothetical protein